MRWLFLALAPLLGGCESLPPAVAADPSSHTGSDALHDEAARELAAAKETAYSHRTHVDEGRGVFEYDCSGFVDYALARSAPDALETLRIVGPHRPRAKTYVELLASMQPGQRRGRWARLAVPSELRPGDVVAVLAWSEKPDAWGLVNSGHVMIADGAPTMRVEGEWVVPIVDSSGGHGGADTRAKPDRTGLGRGTIVLVVDRGSVVGLRWSETSRTVITTPVVMGRLE